MVLLVRLSQCAPLYPAGRHKMVEMNAKIYCRRDKCLFETIVPIYEALLPLYETLVPLYEALVSLYEALEPLCGSQVPHMMLKCLLLSQQCLFRLFCHNNSVHALHILAYFVNYFL